MAIMTKQTVATWACPMDFTNTVSNRCRFTWTMLAQSMIAAGRTGGLHGVEIAPNQWARDFSDQEAADEWSNMLRALSTTFDIPFISVVDVEYDPLVFAGKDRTKGIDRFNVNANTK